jgi:hypothetical protein
MQALILHVHLQRDCGDKHNLWQAYKRESRGWQFGFKEESTFLRSAELATRKQLSNKSSFRKGLHLAHAFLMQKETTYPTKPAVTLTSPTFHMQTCFSSHDSTHPLRSTGSSTQKSRYSILAMVKTLISHQPSNRCLNRVERTYSVGPVSPLQAMIMSRSEMQRDAESWGGAGSRNRRVHHDTSSW